MKKRKYTPTKRAVQQQGTRERIVRATMELHSERGFRDTTVSAIAERAGVQRLTVYRHFPDAGELFVACSSLWLEHNPPPDPGQWRSITDPSLRLQTALQALYRYYRNTARMWILSYREQDAVAELKGVMAGFEAYLRNLAGDLVRPWIGAGGADPELIATVDLCVRFQTWQNLDHAGLGDAAMAALARCWAGAAVRCAHDRGPARAGSGQSVPVRAEAAERPNHETQTKGA